MRKFKFIKRSFINGTPYLKTTYRIVDPQLLLKNNITTKSKPFVKARNVKTVLKDKVKTIVNKNNILLLEYLY